MHWCGTMSVSCQGFFAERIEAVLKAGVLIQNVGIIKKTNICKVFSKIEKRGHFTKIFTKNG